jgi:hypothetical protein
MGVSAKPGDRLGQWPLRRGVQPRALWLVGAGMLGVLSCGGPDVGPSPTRGSILVSTVTAGAGTDEDGYTVALDGVTQGAIGVRATLQLDSIEVGSHTVRLDGLERNCETWGENFRDVVVEDGAPATVDFTVYCTHAYASLEVTTTTTGPSPDPDGYLLTVDGATPAPIGVNATVLVEYLAPQSHTVSLSDLAPNCHVEGDNPHTTAVLGYGERAAVTFSIICSAT